MSQCEASPNRAQDKQQRRRLLLGRQNFGQRVHSLQVHAKSQARPNNEQNSRHFKVTTLKIFPINLTRPPKETATVGKDIIEGGRIQRQRCDKLTETGAPLHSYPVIKLLQEALPSRISGGSNRATCRELTNSSVSPARSALDSCGPRRRGPSPRNPRVLSNSRQVFDLESVAASA